MPSPDPLCETYKPRSFRAFSIVPGCKNRSKAKRLTFVNPYRKTFYAT